MRILGCIGITLLACLRLSAQVQLQETIEVSIVNVEVVVTDKAGNRVPGLTLDDFELRENGKIQPITNFLEYAPATHDASIAIADAEPNPSPHAAEPKGARRNIILFVEPTQLANFRAKEMFDSLRKLLRENVRPGDQAAITTWGYAPRVRQAFTDDVSRLTRTLDELETEASSMRPSGFAVVGQADRALDQFMRTTVNADGSGDDGLFNAFIGATAQLDQIKRKTAVLQSLMHSIAGFDGKKILIMATHRFGLYAGAEYFQGTVPASYRAALSTASYRDALIRTANANGITLYPIDPEGLGWTPLGAEQAMPTSGDLARMGFDNLVLTNEVMSLREIAEETGGLTAFGTRDSAALFPQIAGDLNSYYSLGYRAQTTGQDSRRDIVVRTKHGDYNVRARRQFVEKSDETRMSDRVIAHLFQPVEGGTIAVEPRTGAIRQTRDRRWSVPLEIRVPIAALTALPHGSDQAGEFSVYVVTGGRLGIMSDVETRTQSFAIPVARMAEARKSHFTYELTIDVDELADRIVVGVFDEVGKEFGLAQVAIPARTRK
jgi:VWFA-related protein